MTARQPIETRRTTYRVAVGLDLIEDFDNQDKGIGTGADQIAPFAGIALGLKRGTTSDPGLDAAELQRA